MFKQQPYPDFLENYNNLRSHFEEQYTNCDSNQKGDRFAIFVSNLVPYTSFGRDFEKPELSQKSHDGGVDLKAINMENEVLLIQSKYSLRDKADFGTIISKFQDFYRKHYSDEPLFAFSGLEMGTNKKIRFQIVTLHDLSRIRKAYEESELSSVGFYRQLVTNDQLEIIDGNSILQLLRTAYRRANFLPLDFDLEFTKGPIEWDGVFIGVVSSTQLKKLYEEYGDGLFFENLRDFLSSTEVNLEIVNTIKKEPDQLLARNNGVVFKATNIERSDNSSKIKLYEGSVVNGCQTTLSVVLNAVSECYVLVKVVKTTSEKAWDITRSANFQNQVKRFDLELAQFLRPQIVKKVATKSGINVKGNLSASSIIGAISDEEVFYEELRSLFIGIFSQRPSNIFDTEYTQLMPGVMDLFFREDPEGTKLFNWLFTIFHATSIVANRIKKNLKKRRDTASHDTYHRFFTEGKFSYRAFFTLLAASSVSGIDISEQQNSDEARHEYVRRFLQETVKIIENDTKKFDKFYRYTIQAMSASVKGRDKGEIQQYLWKYMRNTEFGIFLERVYQAADLDESLSDEGFAD